MKVKVGKVYKCGDTFVKIREKIKDLSTGFRYLGVEWDIKKGECTDGPYIGRFFCDGEGRIDRNPEPLRYQLEEIEEPAIEMTISEISKALGKQIKIVKEKDGWFILLRWRWKYWR